MVALQVLVQQFAWWSTTFTAEEAVTDNECRIVQLLDSSELAQVPALMAKLEPVNAEVGKMLRSLSYAVRQNWLRETIDLETRISNVLQKSRVVIALSAVLRVVIVDKARSSARAVKALLKKEQKLLASIPVVLMGQLEAVISS